MIGILNVGGFEVTLIISMLGVKQWERVHVVGWICAIFNIAVFAAPLSIMVYTLHHHHRCPIT